MKPGRLGGLDLRPARRTAALAALTAFAALGPAGLVPVWARQVTTNQNALEQLGPVHHSSTHAASPHHAKPAHATARTNARGPSHHAAQNRGAARPASQTTPAPRRIGRPPVMPLHPPAPPVIAPPALHVDLHPPPLPPPLPIDPKAQGSATPIPGGSQITFGAGSSSLNPATDRALLEIAARARSLPDDVVEIDAYAAPVREDPSTPRRLSLGRALAARATLINAGIASTRIYARALGAAAVPLLGSIAPQPADRIDVTVEHDSRSPDIATAGDTQAAASSHPPVRSNVSATGSPPAP